MSSKTCKQCNIEKDESCFMTCFCKKRNKTYTYNDCIECRYSNTRSRYEKNKKTKEYNEMSIGWYTRYTEKIKGTSRADEIREGHRIRRKARIEILSDKYIAEKIVKHTNGLLRMEDITSELINLKRKKIQSWRKLQVLKNSSPVHQK